MRGLRRVFAPAATPAAVIRILNRETIAVLRDPETRDWLMKVGIEPVGGTPQQFLAAIKKGMARSGKVIRAAGIRTD